MIPSTPGAAAAVARPTRGVSRGRLRRRLLELGTPVVVQATVNILLTQVDRLMVGQLGSDVIAGVGLAAQLLGFLTMAFSAMVSGCGILVAQHYGARQDAELRAAFGATCWLNVGLGSVLALPVILFAPHLLSLLGAAPAVSAAGGHYLAIEALGFPAILVALLAGSTLRSLGDTRSTLWAALATISFKLVLNALLIFGLGPVPALGITGAAAAGVAAQVLNATLLMAALVRPRAPGPRRWPELSLRGLLVPRFAPLRRIVPLMLPILGDMVVWQGASLAYSALLAGAGTSALAAWQIFLSVRAFGFIPVWGIRQAAETTTGHLLGQSRPWRARVNAAVALRLTLWTTALSCAFFVVGAPAIAGLYQVDAQTRILATGALVASCLVQPFENLNALLPGLLRAGGDARAVMLTSAATFWLIGVGGAFLLGSLLGLGFWGIFAAVSAECALKALLFLRRYRRGTWLRRLV